MIIGLTLALTSMASKSPTFDETSHIAAGYSYLVTDDYRVNIEHPPLIKRLAALPLLILKPRFTPEALHAKAAQWNLGRKFLFTWNEPDRLVFWARVPIVLLFLSLGAMIYCCAREFYGPRSGLVALLLYLFTPDFLAHGQLVTTDLAISLFTFSTVYFFYRALCNRSPANVAGFALSLGLAAISKFSAGLLVIILLTLVTICLLDRNNRMLHLPESALASSPCTRRQWLGILAGTGLVVTWLLIWMIYGFRFSLTPDAAGLLDGVVLGDSGFLPRIAATLQRLKLLPEGYTGGFISCVTQLQGRSPYFFGTYSDDYWWCYYPATFLLKTPLPLIILIAVGFVRRMRSVWPRRDTFFLLLPAAIYLLIAIATKVNVGHRHLLPIYPFLIVWVAEIGRDFEHLQFSLKKYALIALIAWQILGTLSIYPNFLTFFNELGGGPKHGYRYLIDSNLDWGQDLKGLAAYRNQHPRDTFYVSYFGTADPKYYLRDVYYLPCHMEVEDVQIHDLPSVPPGAYIAISATMLMSIDIESDDPNSLIAKKLQETRPTARIGNSILIYRMP